MPEKNARVANVRGRGVMNIYAECSRVLAREGNQERDDFARKTFAYMGGKTVQGYHREVCVMRYREELVC